MQTPPAYASSSFVTHKRSCNIAIAFLLSPHAKQRTVKVMRNEIVRRPVNVNDDETVNTGRLPQNVQPVYYNLTLSPNLRTFKTTGTVSIYLSVLKDSRSITLHTLDLDIQEPKVLSRDRTVDITHTEYNTEAQTVTLTLSEILPAGFDVQLTLNFAAKLEEGSAGLFLAKTGERDGDTQYVVVSQMEPIACRRVFPCFDEPALKATFNITMTADKALTCLSNMDVKHVEDEGEDFKKWVFNTTPPMSTYLLAFAVGEFKVIETDSFRVPVRVYATVNNENIEHGRFALDLAVTTIKFFEEKLGMAYPLPKLDMLGSPHFLGAMENWGLVTYGDRYLIMDEKTAAGAMIQLTVSIVQHELAHQWFGNIVTMEYWDGLWLNEGFATWAALYGNDALYPEWKLWQSNLAGEYEKAFAIDSLRSSHPVEIPIKRAEDINQAFSDIAYAKGSSVLCMIAKYIGVDTFLAGVRKYLKTHEYKNTKTDDLWNALTETSAKDIHKFGDIWTRQVGHPVLTVTEGDDWIKVRQNRFLRTGNVSESEDQTLFPIFLGLRTSKGVDDLAFDTRELTFSKSDDFFKINADHIGFYRTLYQPERLDKLVEARAKLTPEDRFSLITDASALSASGHQKTIRTLKLIEQLGDDSDYLVWKGLATTVSAIGAAWIFEDDDYQRRFAIWRRQIVSSKAHELGWKFARSGDLVRQQFQVLMFDAAVRAGDRQVIEAALNMWERFRKGDHAAIDPNISTPVFVAALNHSDDPETVYEILQREHRNANSGTLKRDMVAALGSARQPELIQRTLQLALSDEVPNTEIELPLHELCKFEDGLRASLEWLMENFEKLNARLGTGMQMLGRILVPVVGAIASDDALKEVQDFFKTQSTDAFRLQLEEAFEEARVKINWVNRDRDEVKRWLDENVSL